MKPPKNKKECLCDVPHIKKRIPQPKTIKKTADQLKLLAHPTRLHILAALAQKDCCVCVLTAVTCKKQANISQHLAKLKDNNVIDDYQQGKFIYYTFKDEHTRQRIQSLIA